MTYPPFFPCVPPSHSRQTVIRFIITHNCTLKIHNPQSFVSFITKYLAFDGHCAINDQYKKIHKFFRHYIFLNLNFKLIQNFSNFVSNRLLKRNYSGSVIKISLYSQFKLQETKSIVYVTIHMFRRNTVSVPSMCIMYILFVYLCSKDYLWILKRIYS